MFGQNRIYMLYIQYFWQGINQGWPEPYNYTVLANPRNNQIYGHAVCIYIYGSGHPYACTKIHMCFACCRYCLCVLPWATALTVVYACFCTHIHAKIDIR